MLLLVINFNRIYNSAEKIEVLLPARSHAV